MAVREFTKTVDGKTVKYYVAFVDTINILTGRRVTKQIGNISSKPKAERIYREVWSKLRNEPPEFSGVRRFGQLKMKYLEYIWERGRDKLQDGFARQSLKTKESRLKATDCWNNMMIKGINAKFVRDELDRFEIQKGMSRSQTLEILKDCKVLMEFGVECGLLKINPLRDLKRRKPKKRGKCLTREEANKLLFEARHRSHPFYSIWLLSIFTGLRRSELAGLKWTDIDWENGLAYIERQLIPNEGIIEKLKDEEDRVVALHKDLLNELRKMKLKAKSEFVIEFEEKDRVLKGRWDRGEQAPVLRKFCREIGITEVTHHQLRATFITLALSDNVPLGKVKELAGHSSLEITDIYFRRSGVGLKGSTDQMSIKIPSDEGKLVELPRTQGHK